MDDIFWFRYVNNWAAIFPWWDFFGKIFASGLIWVMLFGLLVIFVVRSTEREARHEFATVLITAFAGLFVFVVHAIIGLWYFRPRPFVDLPGVHLLLTNVMTEQSFPSLHAAFAFTIATAVFLAHRLWGLLFFVLAALVAFGRVFVGVHYPSDVIGGAVLGSVIALLVHRYGRGFFERLLKKGYGQS